LPGLTGNEPERKPIGMAGTQKAIISWGFGKRNSESTMDFLHDLRSRVISHCERSEAIQKATRKNWIASSFALRSFRLR
jgi:hypothetical protein